MTRRRENTFPGWQPGLYEYKGKRRNTYFTITDENQKVNLGHNLIEAKKALLTLEESAALAGTISELLDDYLAVVLKKVQAKKRSMETYITNVGEVVQLKKSFGRMKPAALRTSGVWRYLHKERGLNTPVRANREIAFLQAAYTYACNAGIVDINPCVGAERNEETARERYVTHPELKEFSEFARAGKHLKNDAARKWSDGGLRLALGAELAYLTAKAQAQILKLPLSMITDEGIEFGKRKGGARTLVTWTPDLRRVVDELLALPCKAGNVRSMYLVCQRDGSPYSKGGFKSMWNRLQTAWEETGHEWFTFHDLRAKAVTDVIEKGRKASELTGHRDETMPAQVYDRRHIRKSPAVR